MEVALLSLSDTLRNIGYDTGYTLLAILSLLLIFAAYFLVLQALRVKQLPRALEHLPWVGLDNRRYFPKLRACLGELSNQKYLEEGYNTYGKNGKAFIMPTMSQNIVVLPPNDVSWAAHQGDQTLSAPKIMEDALEWLAHGPTKESVTDFSVIRRDLTRQLMKLNDEVLDEVRYATDDKLGLSTEWREVKMQKMIRAIAFRAANRIFGGALLCRSDKYEGAIGRWLYVFVLTILIIRYLVPKVLRPYVMPLIALPSQVLLWWATSYIKPGVRQRLEETKVRSTGAEKPNDMLQWIIDAAAQKGDPRELYVHNIAGKMVLLNVFATLTTSTMTGLTLLNLLAHEDARSILQELQEEAHEVIPALSGGSRSVRDMLKLDSVIRETLRWTPLGAEGIIREVVKPGGIVTPDGLYLPEGTRVAVAVTPMQKDVERSGIGADQYRPLRHCAEAVASQESGLDGWQKIAVQINERFLPFGLGKHACPGRFFAVHLMKLILGYIIAEYELEPFTEQPKFIEFGGSVAPDERKSYVRLRRRSVEKS